MAINFDQLGESPHLLDVLVQMEDVLDSFDCYVFENWINGEIIDGPKVRRYWFDFTLRYPIDEMPEATAAKRLMKHGVRVNYEKASVEDESGEIPSEPNFWEIKISIPSKLIKDMNAAELEFYDADIDATDVQDAQDSGMTDDTGFVDDVSSSNLADPEAGGEEDFDFGEDSDNDT